MSGGGLYVDADLRPTAATLASLLRLGPRLHLTVQSHLDRCGIQNDVIFATRRHPLFERFIRACIENIIVKEIKSPQAATGPAAFSRAVHDLILEGNVAETTSLSRWENADLLAPTYPASYKNSSKAWQVAWKNLNAPADPE